MPLEKAFITTIKPDSSPLGTVPIIVLFNPNEYSIERSNQFQRTALPGTATPVTQFVSGNTQTLTVDLFFDTYEAHTNVRDQTKTVVSLMDINPELHAPPICIFSWGDLHFKGTVEQVTQKFTLFLDTGIPVRATLSVTFKEYKTLSEQVVEVRKESSDRTKRLTVKQGDSLYLIANREYEDSSSWRPIARANKISNPRIITVGQEVVIPRLR